MDLPKSEFLGVIFQLLPGFLSAWVFYSFSSYKKPDVPERIIQALIFTVLSKVCTIGAKHILFAIGKIHSFGTWDADSEMVTLVGSALAIGVMASWFSNNDFPHRFLRVDGEQGSFNTKFNLRSLLPKLGLTNKTLHPSEWYSFFRNVNCWAILHLDGERRLMCLLHQFPDTPFDGHFIVHHPSWLLDDGKCQHFPDGVEILIGVKEVVRVELLREGIPSTQ